MRVLPIKLIGFGTKEVESFASFIYRTAMEHGVSVGVYIRRILELGIYDGILSLDTKIPKHVKCHSLMKKSTVSKDLTEVLSVYLRQNLVPSTLWYLSKFTNVNTKGVENGFKWCPECISEQMQSGEKVYFKVKWHISDIHICDYHKTKLISECEYCGASQTSYYSKYMWGCCRVCGISLGKRISPVEPEDLVTSWDNECRCFEQMIIEMEDAGEYLECEGESLLIGKTLAEQIKYRIDNNYIQDEKIKKVYQDFLQNNDGWGTYTDFNGLRRIACSFGVDLFEILYKRCPSLGLPLPLELSELCHCVHLKESTKKRVKHNHEEIGRQLVQIINNSMLQPSLKQVARTLKVSVGYLEYRFPHLVKQITSQYMAQKRTEAEERKRKAISYAMNFFYDEKYSDYNKSRKQAYKIIREETGLPKFMLREAIQRVYEIYYSE